MSSIFLSEYPFYSNNLYMCGVHFFCHLLLHCISPFPAPDPPTDVTVVMGRTTNIVVTWTPPTQGVTTCSGGVTYTVNVSITSGGPIVQRNVKGTNITVDVGLCAVTGVSVVSINSLGSSKPAVWTVLDISPPGSQTTESM